MTVEFQGHVEKIVLGTSDRVHVFVHGAMHRTREKIVVEMSRQEAQHYMPGSGVTIQIRPCGDVGKPFPSAER
jgi:hypothetical protein